MASSSRGSLGEWIRLLAYDADTPRRPALDRVEAFFDAAGARPAAPKKPSIPARAIATTSSAVAIPFAIEPATRGKRTP